MTVVGFSKNAHRGLTFKLVAAETIDISAFESLLCFSLNTFLLHINLASQQFHTISVGYKINPPLLKTLRHF